MMLPRRIVVVLVAAVLVAPGVVSANPRERACDPLTYGRPRSCNVGPIEPTRIRWWADA